MDLTGKEVTRGPLRGVVTDGVPRKAGVYKGLVSVMWIGGSWTVVENPADLVVVSAENKED